MWLFIAIAVAVVYAALKPLGDGLLDTSMWVAKITSPAEVATLDKETQHHVLRTGQAALMEGWLSNIPFFNTILFVAAIVLGFIYSWWGGIVMFFVLGLFAGVTKTIRHRSVSYYLPFLYHKMINRQIDYKAKNDLERADACESYCKDLQQIMVLYQGSGVKPPNPKEIQHVPYGGLHYLLNRQV